MSFYAGSWDFIGLGNVNGSIVFIYFLSHTQFRDYLVVKSSLESAVYFFFFNFSFIVVGYQVIDDFFEFP